MGAWVNEAGDDMDWTRDQGGTPSGGTGPSTGDGDVSYIYTEASGANSPSKRAYLISQENSILNYLFLITCLVQVLGNFM